MVVNQVSHGTSWQSGSSAAMPETTRHKALKTLIFSILVSFNFLSSHFIFQAGYSNVSAQAPFLKKGWAKQPGLKPKQLQQV